MPVKICRSGATESLKQRTAAAPRTSLSVQQDTLTTTITVKLYVLLLLRWTYVRLKDISGRTKAFPSGFRILCRSQQNLSSKIRERIHFSHHVGIWYLVLHSLKTISFANESLQIPLTLINWKCIYLYNISVCVCVCSGLKGWWHF